MGPRRRVVLQHFQERLHTRNADLIPCTRSRSKPQMHDVHKSRLRHIVVHLQRSAIFVTVVFARSAFAISFAPASYRCLPHMRARHAVRDTLLERQRARAQQPAAIPATHCTCPNS